MKKAVKLKVGVDWESPPPYLTAVACLSLLDLSLLLVMLDIMYYWINSENIHSLWVNLWTVFMYTSKQVFMPYWNFEYTKTVTLH